MTKKLIIGMSVLLLIGGVLFGIGSMIDNQPNSKVAGDSIISLGSTKHSQENSVKMSPFSAIEISVIGADISVLEGDTFSVDYQFHNKEVIERFEVADDTLYLSTDYDWGRQPDYGEWYVMITVPRQTPLKIVNLSSVSGDIVIENQGYTNGTLHTVSGKVALSNISADQVDAQTVSGAISVKESKVTELSVENKTGKIQLDGAFSTLYAHSVSSACELAGSLLESAAIETVSGDITVHVSDNASVEASSYGNVYWNGSNQGYSFEKSDADAKLMLKSVSGEIQVTEGAPV